MEWLFTGKADECQDWLFGQESHTPTHPHIPPRPLPPLPPLSWTCDLLPIILSAMLESLRVKNLAIVEDVGIELGEGLSVITGETGAGKSVLIGALGLLLGERADRSLVRADEKKCTVEAVFRVADNAQMGALMDELGVEAGDDGRLIVRRIIAASGSGKCVVNDCPVTVQALKRIR